jgi:hypothetical protein
MRVRSAGLPFRELLNDAQWGVKSDTAGESGKEGRRR